MNAPGPVSPIHDALLARNPVWSEAGATPPAVLGFDGNDAQRAAVLGLADLSHRPRAGVKGPAAAGWLAALDLPVPAQPNSWNRLPEAGLIARLGLTEYLVEGDASAVDALMQTCRSAGVYPVLRQDASFALCGERVNELLLQTCNVDFRTLDAEPSKLVLTSMAGVGVTILSIRSGCYRLWCDGTYGIYLWDTLVGIAEELRGGCIGLDALHKNLSTPAHASV
jgi:sarcosine oxidase subunit gamma